MSAPLVNTPGPITALAAARWAVVIGTKSGQVVYARSIFIRPKVIVVNGRHTFERPQESPLPISPPVCQLDGPVLMVALDSKITRLVAATFSSIVTFNPADFPSRAKTIHSTVPILATELAQDGQFIVAIHKDDRVRLWNLQTGAVSGPPLAQGAPIAGMSLSADGRFLLTFSRIGPIRLWDLTTHREIKTGWAPSPAARPIIDARISPDGRCFFVLTAVRVDVYPLKDSTPPAPR